MSVPGKDPVYQYCMQLSDAEKADLAHWFETRGCGPSIVLFLEKYFKQKGKKSAAQPEIDEDFLGPVDKHRFKQALVDYVRSKIGYTDPSIEEAVKHGKTILLLGDDVAALEVLLDAMAYILKKERFEDFDLVLQLIESIVRRLNGEEGVVQRWVGMERQVVDLMAGKKDWTELKRLWYDYVVPFQRERDKQGNVDTQSIGSLRLRLMNLGNPFSCHRVAVQYAYMMTFVHLVIGEYTGAMLYNGTVTKTLQEFPWLQAYFPGILPTSLLHGISIRAELQHKEECYSLLDDLRQLAMAEKGDLVWRYVFAGLNVADEFHDAMLNKTIDYIYRTNSSQILESTTDREQILILFYLMRNHLVFGSWKVAQTYSYQMKQFKRTRLELNTQLYSRIFDIAIEWQEGNYKAMKAQIKYFWAFVDRLGLRAKFPQAELAVAAFSFAGKNNSSPEGIIRIEEIRTMLSEEKDQFSRERKYFNFERYLVEIMIPLKRSQYKFGS